MWHLRPPDSIERRNYVGPAFEPPGADGIAHLHCIRKDPSSHPFFPQKGPDREGGVALSVGQCQN